VENFRGPNDHQLLVYTSGTTVHVQTTVATHNQCWYHCTHKFASHLLGTVDGPGSAYNIDICNRMKVHTDKQSSLAAFLQQSINIRLAVSSVRLRR